MIDGCVAGVCLCVSLGRSVRFCPSVAQQACCAARRAADDSFLRAEQRRTQHFTGRQQSTRRFERAPKTAYRHDNVAASRHFAPLLLTPLASSRPALLFPASSQAAERRRQTSTPGRNHHEELEYAVFRPKGAEMAEKNTKNVQRQQTAPAMRQLHGIPPRHGKRGKSTHQGRRQRTEWARSMRVEAPCSSRTAETRGVRSSRASGTGAAAAEQRDWTSRVWRSSTQDSSCWERPKGSRKGVKGRTGFERLLTLLVAFDSFCCSGVR